MKHTIAGPISFLAISDSASWWISYSWWSLFFVYEIM